MMLGLIRKRHEGPGWIVMSELANGTGSNVSRHADAVALGIWPSRGYELHGYEIKCSRGDVQKEINDPRKADAVGKYCDFWWLVVSDIKIIDGITLPSTWGVLTPKNRVLRAVTKAPKLKPKPVDRAFVAAMIRNVTNSWVPSHEHNALKEKQRDELKAELERDRQYVAGNAEMENRRLQSQIEAFEKASGVKLDAWQAGQIGEAVKLALEARGVTGEEASKRRAQYLDNTAGHLEHVARNARDAAKAIREMTDADDQRELPLDMVPRIGGLHG